MSKRGTWLVKTANTEDQQLTQDVDESIQEMLNERKWYQNPNLPLVVGALPIARQGVTLGRGALIEQRLLRNNKALNLFSGKFWRHPTTGKITLNPAHAIRRYKQPNATFARTLDDINPSLVKVPGVVRRSPANFSAPVVRSHALAELSPLFSKWKDKALYDPRRWLHGVTNSKFLHGTPATLKKPSDMVTKGGKPTGGSILNRPGTLSSGAVNWLVPNKLTDWRTMFGYPFLAAPYLNYAQGGMNQHQLEQELADLAVTNADDYRDKLIQLDENHHQEELEISNLQKKFRSKENVRDVAGVGIGALAGAGLGKMFHNISHGNKVEELAELRGISEEEAEEELADSGGAVSSSLLGAGAGGLGGYALARAFGKKTPDFTTKLHNLTEAHLAKSGDILRDQKKHAYLTNALQKLKQDADINVNSKGMDFFTGGPDGWRNLMGNFSNWFPRDEPPGTGTVIK
jgi:hypothetical protein